MLLGRAAPVVNARLLLTEANVVSEDCGRGRGPSHTTPPSYSLYASCGWERSVAKRTPALWVVHAYTEAVLYVTVRDLGHSPRRHHIRTRYTAGVGINHRRSRTSNINVLKARWARASCLLRIITAILAIFQTTNWFQRQSWSILSDF